MTAVKIAKEHRKQKKRPKTQIGAYYDAKK